MAFDPGKLRHRIKIERPVITQDQNSGAPITTWTELATVWAGISHLSGRDLIAAQAEDSKVMGRIMIRYRDDVTDKMRLVHEAKGDIYNIEGLLADPDSGLEYITIPVSLGVKYQVGDPSAVLPVLLTAPTVGGTAEVGEVVEASDGVWANDPVSYTYQWYRQGPVLITGATNETYLLTVAEQGLTVYCAVTVTNAAGSVTTNTAAFGPIAP